MKMLHVTIQTSKFEEEISFYEKYVGLTIQRDMRPDKDLVFLAEAEGDTCVEVIRKLDGFDAGNPDLSIGFKCDNIYVKREELSAAGFEVSPVICPQPEVQFFFAKDPAGVNVQFI